MLSCQTYCLEVDAVLSYIRTRRVPHGYIIVVHPSKCNMFHMFKSGSTIPFSSLSNTIVWLTVWTAALKSKRTWTDNSFSSVFSLRSLMCLCQSFFFSWCKAWLSPSTSWQQISLSYWSQNGPDVVSWVVFSRQRLQVHLKSSLILNSVVARKKFHREQYPGVICTIFSNFAADQCTLPCCKSSVVL